MPGAASGRKGITEDGKVPASGINSRGALRG
jgi:hypothetical protein